MPKIYQIKKRKSKATATATVTVVIPVTEFRKNLEKGKKKQITLTQMYHASHAAERSEEELS